MAAFFDQVAKIAEKGGVARLADNVFKATRDEIIGDCRYIDALNALLKLISKAS
jgi:hypothetical protein